MIKFALRCDNEHGFESWFPDGASFDVQARRGLIACPVCASTRVSKAIMAPSVLSGRKSESRPDEARRVPVTLLDERQQRLRSMVRELRHEIETQTDDVGVKFPQIARAIHDGDAPARAIRGQASVEEAKALIEDGIGVLPLPFLPDDLN